MSPPPKPDTSTLVPQGGILISQSRPTLGLQVKRSDPGLRVKARWQIASDADFTTALKTIPEPDTNMNNGGMHNYRVPADKALAEGTWYIRGYAVQDHTGDNSPPTDTRSFIVQHRSVAASVQPSGGVILAYGAGNVTVSWEVQNPDTTDGQTAYQILVEKNSDGSSVVDTGKTAGAGTSHAVAIPSDHKDTPLRVKVRLWNGEDNEGAYSLASLFQVTDGPSVTVTAPTGSQSTPTPTVTWSYTPAGARAQASFRVILINVTDDGDPVDLGWTPGDATSFVIPPRMLHTGKTYSVGVEVKDTGGFIASDFQTFTTSWSAPTQPTFTVSGTAYAASGYVRIAWTDAQEDANFAAYVVFRRVGSSGAWVQVSDEITTSAASYHFDDYYAGANTAYEWAVVQIKELGGDLVESSRATTHGLTTSSTEAHYYLIEPGAGGLRFKLWHVTEDEFDHEMQEAEFEVIGRGRRIEQGTELGYRGSLTGSLRNVSGGDTARQQRLDLIELKRSGTYVFLRNPFGDVWKVALSTISVSRVGGLGQHEMVNVTVPYAEIY